MAKKQTTQSMGVPLAKNNKGDNKKVVRRRHRGGGKAPKK